MNVENLRKPYLVSGGFKKNNKWIFFTSQGKIEIEGCNDALEVLLPLFDGNNELKNICDKLPESGRSEIIDLVKLLAEHQVIVDSDRIYEIFYAYSRYPSLFSTNMSHEENIKFYYDESHLLPIKGKTFKLSLDYSSFSNLIEKRISSRHFSQESLSENDILNLMWAAYGKHGEGRSLVGDHHYLTFTVPSGGGLYPLFVYLFIFRQCGRIKKGLYLWHKEQSLLEMIAEGDHFQKVKDSIIGVDLLCLQSSVGLICLAADFERSAKKYGNHALNLILLEAGHVMQNAYLFCAHKDIGIVENYGYLAQDLEKILGLNFPKRSLVLTALFGKSEKQS